MKILTGWLKRTTSAKTQCMDWNFK